MAYKSGVGDVGQAPEAYPPGNRAGEVPARTVDRRAAVLAGASLLLLVPGTFVPLVSIFEGGPERTYSLAGGVVKLLSSDRALSVLLGVIVGVFSFLLPYAKALAILAATTPALAVPQRRRAALLSFASRVGKYAVLDLLVVAVAIVALNAPGLLHATARIGVLFFTLAWLLSLLASECVRRGPARAAGAGSGIVRRTLLRALSALVAMVVGLGLLLWAPGRTVTSVEIRNSGGMVPITWETVVNDQPDFYLVFDSKSGRVRTPTRWDTPIGDGMTWELKEAIALDDVNEIAIWDEDGWHDPDDFLDRARVDSFGFGRRTLVGERFKILLDGPLAWSQVVGWVLVLAAFAFLVRGALRLLVREEAPVEFASVVEGPDPAAEPTRAPPAPAAPSTPTT